MALSENSLKRNMVLTTRQLWPLHGSSEEFGHRAFLSRIFPQKLSETGSSHEHLKQLLNREVTRRCLEGRQTILQHRWEVLEQVAKWLGIADDLEDFHDGQVREELIALLSRDVKRKNVRQVPLDDVDWERLLKQWLNHHIVDKDVMSRDIYRLLAVDGIGGYEPSDLKKYLGHMLDPKKVRRDYRFHARAVRSMYNYLDSHPVLSSLIGTDSGCVVFLALLKLFTQTFTEMMQDDDVVMHIRNAKQSAEMFLYRNASYYKDVHAVTDSILDELGDVYKACGHDWSRVGKEQLYEVVNSALKAIKNT